MQCDSEAVCWYAICQQRFKMAEDIRDQTQAIFQQKKQDTRAVAKTCFYCIYRIHS